MKPERKSSQPKSSPDSEATSELPGVPGFRSWRGLYLFVFGFFVIVVVLLTIFSRHFA